MRVAFDESVNYDTNDLSLEIMKVSPLDFITEHKQMLSRLHVMVNKNYRAIPSQYEKLVTSLRSAYATKIESRQTQTSYIDLQDAIRLNLNGYNIK